MRCFSAAVVAVVLTSVTAHAQPGVTPVQPLAQPAQPTAQPAQPASDDAPVESYRLQTFAADAVALGLLVGMTKVDHSGQQNSLAWLFAGTYLLGAPMVHVAHNRPGRAIGDFAMRFALPVLGGLAIGGHGGDDDEGVSVLLGLMVGITASAIIDTAFFAGGDEPRQRSWSPRVTPTTNGGLTVGLGGHF